MQAQSVHDLLIDRRLQLKSTRPGHTEHIVCPKCSGGRTKERCLSVTIDGDGQGVVIICHRASCGWTDGERLHNAPPAPRSERPVVKPRPDSAEAAAYRPDWFYDFFSQRNIGARTIESFGAYAIANRWFPAGDSQAIVFPFFHGGELVNRKYRSYPVKSFVQDKDPLPTLFNVDRLGTDPAEIVWCEGEMDIMAMFECGIPHAVSLKDGTGDKLMAQVSEDDKRFAALRTHADLLTKAKRIVLAGDADGPGGVLREELARRLGRHRCHLVTWPEGCNDACDVLRLHGPDAVVDAVRRAQPYPISGLQRVTPGSLAALRRQPQPPVMTTGTRSTDAILKLPQEGRLIVVTGLPGGGKTTWARFVMVHTAINHDRRWAVFSPEMQPWEQFIASCAEVYSGKPFYYEPSCSSMTDQDISEAEDWLSGRVTMLVCDAEDEAPTLDWILERARAAVLRDGATDLLIDPLERDGPRPRPRHERDGLHWGWPATVESFRAAAWLQRVDHLPPGQAAAGQAWRKGWGPRAICDQRLQSLVQQAGHGHHDPSAGERLRGIASVEIPVPPVWLASGGGAHGAGRNYRPLFKPTRDGR